MQVNPAIFRGYDIRGIVDQDLTDVIVENLGKAYGTYILRQNIDTKALVGYDCRLSNLRFKEALTRGIISTGVDVIDIGLTLAGHFYWAQYYLNIKAGGFVTASHNPAQYNGFKFALGLSRTVIGEETQALRKLMEAEDYIQAQTLGKVSQQDISQAYCKDLASRFQFKKKFKVVVDPSHSTPGAFIPDILRLAGCEVIEQHCQLDGNFPLGTPDPTEKEKAERLAQEVVLAGADLGFSYDADGDRMGLADNKGNIIWNDVIVALFAADAIDRNPGAKIVFNTLCSKVVEDVIKQKGGVALMCRTGNSFIKDKAQKQGAKFAGELSGHFFFLDNFYPHDDGAYASLRLLDYLSRTNQTLNQALESLPQYISSPEIKVGCAEELKVGLIEKISVVLKQDFLEAEIIDDADRAGDGVRLNLADGMLIVRYSQNGPYLTIKFEATTEARYTELKNYINKILRQYPEVDWSYGVNVESLS
jgi:phosphomannomutase/phosphoglucomutase